MKVLLNVMGVVSLISFCGDVCSVFIVSWVFLSVFNVGIVCWKYCVFVLVSEIFCVVCCNNLMFSCFLSDVILWFICVIDVLSLFVVLVKLLMLVMV